MNENDATAPLEGLDVSQPKNLSIKDKIFNKKNIFSVLFVVSSAFSIQSIYQNYVYVSSENASVQAHATLLASEVRGVIVQTYVDENQKVKKGQILLKIRQDDYQNALEQKKADTAALAAQLKGSELSYGRTWQLYKKGVASKEQLDTIEAQFKSLESRLKSSQTEVAQAQLNLDHTQITAPTDGQVGRKSYDIGMIAVPGQPLLGFVSNNERWVTVNLKETEMSRIIEGRQAYVTVDAIPGKEFEGVVDSISPATGASFTLLPPDNSTGNFTKVVQRIPVKIKLLHLNEQDIERLQNGLSAYVKIRVR